MLRLPPQKNVPAATKEITGKMYEYDEKNDTFLLTYPFKDEYGEVGLGRNVTANLIEGSYTQAGLETLLKSGAYTLIRIEDMFA